MNPKLKAIIFLPIFGALIAIPALLIPYLVIQAVNLLFGIDTPFTVLSWLSVVYLLLILNLATRHS